MKRNRALTVLIRSVSLICMLACIAGCATTTPTGNTPLHTATTAQQAKDLLAQGCSVAATNRWGHTPLHSAVRATNDVAALVSVLLANGADVNARDNSGRTPLHSAVRTTNDVAALISVLLANGADVNARDNSGRTPLFHLTGRSETSIAAIQLLVAKGADVNARDHSGDTPLFSLYSYVGSSGAISQSYGFYHRDTTALSAELIRLGADLYATNAAGVTAIESKYAKSYDGPQKLPKDVAFVNADNIHLCPVFAPIEILKRLPDAW